MFLLEFGSGKLGGKTWVARREALAGAEGRGGLGPAPQMAQRRAVGELHLRGPVRHGSELLRHTLPLPGGHPPLDFGRSWRLRKGRAGGAREQRAEATGQEPSEYGCWGYGCGGFSGQNIYAPYLNALALTAAERPAASSCGWPSNRARIR